jgi:hypothetical protein
VVTTKYLSKFQSQGTLLRELKEGETFASLLNIHGGDIRVVPTLSFLYVAQEETTHF